MTSLSSPRPVRPPAPRSAAHAALRSVALGVVLVAALGAVAAAKPKVAILGLEVVGDLDPEQTKLAKQLTAGLRERASAGTGPYELAPNSNRELVDEKLMNNCGTEALSCMSPIGINLAADFLMYGKIEKVEKGYHVTIKLLRVANKLPMPPYSEIILTREIREDLKAVAKRVYARLTASDEGTLTIRVSNADRTTVYVDDEPMGTTSSGVLTIPVPVGRHRVAVVATEKGWRRHEQVVNVNAGDARNIPIELERLPKRAPPREDRPVMIKPPGSEPSRTTAGAGSDGDGGGHTGWRALFALSLAGEIAGGVSWYYGYTEIKDAETKLCTRKDSGCKPADVPSDVRGPAEQQGRRGQIITGVGIGLVALGAVTGVFTFYKGFVASEERKPIGATAGRSTRPRRTLTVTPVIAPSGGGATLRFDW
ncbi:MAG TPA: hypothetical protein VN253_29385 [Kofleriaceae bacterium]|nr:hypothetical protein [Kofleriaceae bacterium]